MAKARQIFGEIKAQKDSRNGRILVFTGARQVGKTTLVKKGLAEQDSQAVQGYRKGRFEGQGIPADDGRS